jgi:hypothetical protein
MQEDSKQDFIPANDFDDIKSVIEKATQSISENQSLFREHCKPE